MMLCEHVQAKKCGFIWTHNPANPGWTEFHLHAAVPGACLTALQQNGIGLCNLHSLSGTCENPHECP